LTVGNEADENGTLTGVKILVFNVTDPYSPFEAGKYVVSFNMAGQVQIPPGTHMHLDICPIRKTDYSSVHLYLREF
jgi:hypothetical protein